MKYNQIMNKIIETFISDYPIDRRYDSMTMAFSKELFEKLGHFLIERNIPYALYFIDFDNFKKVNDSLGHVIGDRVLKDSCDMIRTNVGEKGLFFRVGGDEFALIVPEIQERQLVWNIAHEYSEYVRNHPLGYLDSILPNGRISFTSGIVRYPFDAKDFDSLLKLIDKALYRGKFKGKNCFIIYDKDLHGNIDLEKKSLKLTKTGLITYIFETFNNSKDPYRSLKVTSTMLGKYYNDSLITYHDSERDELLYIDQEEEDVTFVPYDENDFFFDRNERFKYFYRLEASKIPAQKPIHDLMMKNHTRSLLAFRLINGKNEPSYLCIYARRDKVWSDEEFDVYQTMTLLFSTINHYPFR